MKHNFLLVCEDAKTQENIFDGYIFNPFTTVQRFDNFDKFKQTTKFYDRNDFIFCIWKPNEAHGHGNTFVGRTF